MDKKILTLGLLVAIASLCAGYAFADTFQISLATQSVDFQPYGGVEGYAELPVGRVIVIRNQPNPFEVIIRNISDSSQPIYEQANPGGISSVAFEMTDEAGNTFTVKKKIIDDEASDAVDSQYLNPGETKTLSIIMDPQTWENVPLLEMGKVKKYKMRVTYDNDMEKIYSQEYVVILDGRAL